MPEYSEKEAIKAAVRKRLNNSLIISWLIRIINEIPAADVAPVVHGRWVWDEETDCWVCSNCEASALNNYRGNSTDSNYCPNCGAIMDGDGE